MRKNWSNRNITPPRPFDDSDSYNELFSQTNIEEYIEDEKKETEKSKKEGTTPLPMYTGEADMGVDAELEDNNCSYPKILNMTTPNKSSVAKLGTVPGAQYQSLQTNSPSHRLNGSLTRQCSQHMLQCQYQAFSNTHCI